MRANARTLRTSARPHAGGIEVWIVPLPQQVATHHRLTAGKTYVPGYVALAKGLRLEGLPDKGISH